MIKCGLWLIYIRVFKKNANQLLLGRIKPLNYLPTEAVFDCRYDLFVNRNEVTVI